MRPKTRGWSTVVIGMIVLIAGLAWGLIGSHQIAYESSQSGADYNPQFGETSGNLYFHVAGSPDYFIAFASDFDPAISQSDFANMDHYVFLARTDTSDPNITLSGTSINSAHKVEKLTLYAKDGSVISTHTTAEYTANPNGVYVSVWSNAGWLAGFGLLLAVAGLLQALRAPKTNFSIGTPGTAFYQPVPPAYPPTQPGAGYPPAGAAYPPTQPGAGYPPADPYGQAYRGPEQYPSSNPYNQPPQS